MGEDQEARLRFPQGWSAGQLSCLGCLLPFFVLNNPATCHSNSALDILNTVGENHTERSVAGHVGEGLVLTRAKGRLHHEVAFERGFYRVKRVLIGTVEKQAATVKERHVSM